MASTFEIVIPDFDFSGFYYPEIRRSLTQFKRVNVPEITSEEEEEPFEQLLSAYALVGHLNNVLLDIVANESLLPTARLLESVRGHLALIDFQLNQAAPSTTDEILKLSKVFLVPFEFIPEDTPFGTVETEGNPVILFENPESVIVQPTNLFTNVFTFKAGKIKLINNAHDGGDGFNIEGTDFISNVDYAVGGTILETINNATAAINGSGSANIKDLVYAINNGVDQISIIQLNESLEVITITEIDGATDNYEVSSGGFGAEQSGKASTDTLLFPLFDEEPKVGDIVYLGHASIMWDQIEWIFDTVGAGINFVLEFFDNSEEDAKPTSITNLGPNLEIDLTSLLGDDDRTGTVVRIRFSETGAEEQIVSFFSGGINKALTAGILGQTVVSLDVEDYIIGTFWNETDNFVDNTNGLTEDESFTYELPQTLSKNWQKKVINNAEGFFIRLRVISVAAPTIPIVDRILIDEGSQYLLTQIVQGQTVVDDPVGSSNGDPDQEFLLNLRPLITGSLTLEINEGAGFQAWNLKDNFLASNSASKDYTVTIDASDIATLKFGDSKQGKIPVVGVDNIRAVYRIGADQDGNVGANTITVNKGGLSFVDSVFNPRAAIGWSPKDGSTEEDLERLKVVGPASLRTRNRAITTDDFEFLAEEFTDANGSKTVARALAIEETFGVKTVEVVVVGFGGVLLTEAQRDTLRDFFNGNKELGIDPVIVANHEAVIVNYTPKIINVTVDVVGGEKAPIENAITALLNPEATFDDGVTKRWSFGQEVPTSVIVSAIFEVDQVNIKKVTLTLPAADVPLDERELPLAGNVVVTVT